MKLKVIRGAGDNPREPIIDKLISSIPAAQARGRVEMDLGQGLTPVAQTVPHEDDRAVGDIVKSTDRFNAEQWNGVITGIEYGLQSTGNGVMPVISLDLMRDL
jgi:hypothetical protein